MSNKYCSLLASGYPPYERQITIYTLVLVLLVYLRVNPLGYEINLKYI